MGAAVKWWVLVGLVALVGCAPKRAVRTTYYPDGSPRWQVETRNGIPHGRSVTWYRDGAKQSEGWYENGEQVGELRTWDDRGGETESEPDTDEADETPSRTSLAIGVGIGGGTPPPADPVNEGDIAPSGGRIGLSAVVAMRVGPLLAGALGENLSPFSPDGGPGHRYVGALVGLAFGDRATTAEVAVEAGSHRIGVAGGLFGSGHANRRYTGLRTAWWFSGTGRFAVGLSGTVRRDLDSGPQDVSIEHCYAWGCSTSIESWRVGGWSAAFAFGMRVVLQ